jgi:hypothetical protein
MEKAALAQLKAAISEQQQAEDMLDWAAGATTIIITLRGDNDRTLRLDVGNEDYDAVLATVQKVAAAQKQAKETEIDTIITAITAEPEVVVEP